MRDFPISPSLILAAALLAGIAMPSQAQNGTSKQGPSATTSDQNAAEEPSTKPGQPAGETSTGAFVNGSISPDQTEADRNSQTSPAKFSKLNAALDKIPTMARGPVLTDQDKTVIWSNVKMGTTPASRIAGPATLLPHDIKINTWPQAVMDKIPALTGTGYVALSDRLVVVSPPNGIVVSEILKDGK